MNCKISVVFPIYQVEEYIEDSMNSIVMQSFKDFEVILVNDGTMDSSITIAESVLKGKKINYKIINQNNKGVSAARNTGIRHSTGEWVICIDPDDVIHEAFLMTLYNCCIGNHLDVAIANYQMVSNETMWDYKQKIQESKVLKQEDILHQFLTRKIKIISPGILVRKELIITNELWYDEEIQFSEDQHLIWRLLFSVDRIGYNPTPIYHYLKRENSTMTSSKREKILTGYYGFEQFIKEMLIIQQSEVVSLIFPRWILGVLRASSKIMSSKDFIELAETMEYKKNIRKLLFFPELKTRILSLILLINWKLFYIVVKKA